MTHKTLAHMRAPGNDTSTADNTLPIHPVMTRALAASTVKSWGTKKQKAEMRYCRRPNNVRASAKGTDE
jgi:hypothetical protein